MPDNFITPAAEDMDNLLYISAVFLPGDVTHAGRLATADMEVQARTEFVPQDGFGGDFQIAGPQRIHFPEEIQQVPRVHHVAVRAEVTVSLALFYAAGDEYLRKIVSGNANPGIGF